MIAEVSAAETQTSGAALNLSSRQLQCRLGAASYTANTNTNTLTGSGEDRVIFHAVDLTSHFTTNWTGTSMTMDAQFLFNDSGTGAAWTNICVTVLITYEYDDTSSTHIKTVRIPLNAPLTGLAGSKPGTATATIPDLDADLPEASKVYRSTHIVIQGNRNTNNVTDMTLSAQLDSTTALTTGTWEGISQSDYWFRYVWDVSAVLDTTNTMGFYIWASTSTNFQHPQAWLVVTYEFDATSSNDVWVSLLLPMNLEPPIGGSSSTSAQRGRQELWIEEPGTITTQETAFYFFWDSDQSTGGLEMRIGTGAFVAYTDTKHLTACGSNGAMVRNDSAFTLARGRNALNFNCFSTEAIRPGWAPCGFFLINYTASKPTDGYGAANHTVFWNLGATYASAGLGSRTSYTAIAPVIPEAEYFLNGPGIQYRQQMDGVLTFTGVVVTVERLSAENGIKWESVINWPLFTDIEQGLRHAYGTLEPYFWRWAGDPDTYRFDPETARRWRTICPAGNWIEQFEMVFSYHTITFEVAGEVTGSAGGTVNLTLHRAEGGDKVASTSRSGNGAYSMTWYDDTEAVFVSASEDATHVGSVSRGRGRMTDNPIWSLADLATPVMADLLLGVDSPASSPATRKIALSALAPLTVSNVTVQVKTVGSGFYTPTTGMKKVLAIAVGGGGGGHGGVATDSAGGGGGSGGTCIRLMTAADIGASKAYVVGAGGAAGSNGTATSLDGGALMAGNTGAAGIAGAQSGALGVQAAGGSGGAVPTVGDLKIAGNSGGRGITYSGADGSGGRGGDSIFGFGGRESLTDTAGIAGTGYGSGGGGGHAATTSDRVGGAGANGILYLIEFIG